VKNCGRIAATSLIEKLPQLPRNSGACPAEARARAIFDGFQRGTLDRKLFSDDANAFLTPSVLADQKKALAPSGPPRAFTLQNETDQDGWKLRNWKIRTTNERLLVEEIDSPDGKVELFAVSKAY